MEFCGSCLSCISYMLERWRKWGWRWIRAFCASGARLSHCVTAALVGTVSDSWNQQSGLNSSLFVVRIQLLHHFQLWGVSSSESGFLFCALDLPLSFWRFHFLGKSFIKFGFCRDSFMWKGTFSQERIKILAWFGLEGIFIHPIPFPKPQFSPFSPCNFWILSQIPALFALPSQ